MTLALHKVGLVHAPARLYVGELYLADINVPPELYGHLGLDVATIFARRGVLHLVRA